MLNLGEPFGFDVVEGGRADDREADEEDVRLWIGEGSKSVIIFLPGRIPQAEADGFSINHHTRRVIVEAVQAGQRQSDVGVQKGTDTVGMYSPGKAFVVYEMRRHVFVIL